MFAYIKVVLLSLVKNTGFVFILTENYNNLYDFLINFFY